MWSKWDDADDDAAAPPPVSPNFSGEFSVFCCPVLSLRLFARGFSPGRGKTKTLKLGKTWHTGGGTCCCCWIDAGSITDHAPTRYADIRECVYDTLRTSIRIRLYNMLYMRIYKHTCGGILYASKLWTEILSTFWYLYDDKMCTIFPSISISIRIHTAILCMIGNKWKPGKPTKIRTWWWKTM